MNTPKTAKGTATEKDPESFKIVQRERDRIDLLMRLHTEEAKVREESMKRLHRILFPHKYTANHK